MIDADGYQRAARRTTTEAVQGDELILNCALGLAGEAGEIADHVKKWRFHAHNLDRAHLAEELGDMLWYAAVLADELRYPLSAVMDRNLEKLRRRYPDGFDPERSRNRTG